MKLTLPHADARTCVLVGQTVDCMYDGDESTPYITRQTALRYSQKLSTDAAPPRLSTECANAWLPSEPIPDHSTGGQGS